MSGNIKKILVLSVTFFICFSAFSAGKQSSQIIKSGHWIYDDLEQLSAESKNTMFLEIQPLSVGEINFYLKSVDYGSLSASGKAVYDRVYNFLNDEDDFIKNEGLRLFCNVKANPELFYKSNPNIDWTFSPNFKDNPVTFPVIIGFSDYFTIQSDLGFTKYDEVAAKHDNFSNISFDIGDYTMYMPSFAYFSGTKVFDQWGISAHIGKEGMRVGNTHLGSIVYNDTFKTDFYSQLNLFTNWLKFSIDVTQFSKDKYLYLHQLTLRPFKNFNIGVLEGSLITTPFELRFLNPLMIMHSYMAWNDYDAELKKYYGESNFCAYLGFTFEYLPIRNLRIYGLYAQNEIMDFGTLVSGNPSQSALAYPDSIGAQLGAEYFIPLENSSSLTTRVEAVYTSPYLYVKQTPDWSLIRTYRAGSNDVQSWLGSPFGPDSFILHSGVEYDSNKNWTVGLDYNFMIHGENTASNLFNKNDSTKWNGDKWIYYPPVNLWNEAKTDAEKEAAVKRGRYMWMTGTPEYRHQIKLNGSYKIFPNLELTGQFAYTFVFNNRNIPNNFDQGVEFAIALTYELFPITWGGGIGNFIYLPFYKDCVISYLINPIYVVNINSFFDAKKNNTLCFDETESEADLELASDDSVRLFANIILNPELFYKSNKNINWTFDTNFKDYPITIPIIIGFSDYFTIESDLFIGMHRIAGASHNHFTNIPINGSQLEFTTPIFAYFSGAKIFNNWGISAHMGKQGKMIGNTSLGSIIYNNTFETDFYFQLNLFNKFLKYGMGVIQVDNKKFLYTHEVTFKPFKNLSLGVIEGSLLNSPFELRYLNPLMIMHSFGSWIEYDKTQRDFYRESNFCAYLGFTLEYIPIRNMRIYGMYAQNEILDLGGSRSQSALSVPDSIGAQLGIEYFIPLKNSSTIKIGTEAVYTSPFLYVKHSPDWSLYRNRLNMHSSQRSSSWIGSPFGPDCFAINGKVIYDSNKKWSLGLDYTFIIHGENTAENLFSRQNFRDDFWHYYPSVKYDESDKLNNQSGKDAAVKEGRNMWMTGIPEYKHQIKLNGSYKILPNLELTGQFAYTFVFNNRNIEDNFQQGVELAMAVTYNLF